MDRIEKNTEKPCSAGCSHCSSAAPKPVTENLITGWRLGLWAALTFLGPLALAICGAAVCGPDGVGELAGGLGGLAAGAITAAVITRVLRSRQAT